MSCCQCGNEYSGFTKYGEFLQLLSLSEGTCCAKLIRKLTYVKHNGTQRNSTELNPNPAAILCPFYWIAFMKFQTENPRWSRWNMLKVENLNSNCLFPLFQLVLLPWPINLLPCPKLLPSYKHSFPSWGVSIRNHSSHSADFTLTLENTAVSEMLIDHENRRYIIAIFRIWLYERSRKMI